MSSGSIRIIQLPEKSSVNTDDYMAVDSSANGTKKVKFTDLLDDNLSAQNKAADAQATGEAINGVSTRVDNMINTQQNASVTTLWTGTLNTYNQEVTLSDNISNYDFIDIYVSQLDFQYIRRPVSYSVGVEIQCTNLLDTGDPSLIQFYEGHLTIIGTTAKITKANVVNVHGNATYEAPTAILNSEIPNITRIDGVKIGHVENDEIVDARVGADGVTYPTLGDAIRSQVTNLESDISEMRYPTNLFEKSNFVFGEYLRPDGSTTSDGIYGHSGAIAINANRNYSFKVYTSKFGSGAKTALFYASDNTLLATDGVITDGILTVSAPSNATTLKVNIKNTDIQSFMVCEGNTIPQEYVPYGVVQMKSEVKLSNIGTDELDFVSPQSVVNMLNLNDADIIYGKDILYNGNFADNSNMIVSGFIPCNEGDTFTLPIYTNHFGTSSSAKYVAGYNGNKEWVRAMAGTLSDSFLTFTVPSGYGVQYFRVNVIQKNVNSNYILTPYHAKNCFMVVKGSTMPSRFYPYISQSIVDGNVYSAHENLNNPLYAKNVIFLGDSICEGDANGGWAQRIGVKNTMLWENAGIGGSTISTALASKVICTRAVKMTNPDYIILEGGTNDADRIGDATGQTKPVAFGTWSESDYGTNDAETYYGFDIDTFCGAVDYMCKRFVSEYPHARIGFIGAQKMGTVASTRENRGYYIHTAMDICKKWGIPCLNLWDTCHLNPDIPSHYTSGENYMYIDGQHLTDSGYNYISPIIEAWMKTL